MLTGPQREIEQGYFAGRIVNFSKTPSLTLPYPIIEGMSGSPVLTYRASGSTAYTAGP